MKIVCLHNLADMADLRTQINALNLASSAPDPFSTFEYYSNLVVNDASFFDGHSEIWFLCALAGDCLVGYLALKRSGRKVLWRKSHTLQFLVGYESGQPRVVAQENDKFAVVHAFYDYLCQRSEWDLLELQQQSPDSLLLSESFALRVPGFRAASWPTMHSYAVPMRSRSFSAYFKSLPRKFRRSLQLSARKLFAAGEPTLMTTQDPTSTRALLALYLAIEPHSWKTAAGLSIGADVTRSAFIQGLLANRAMRTVLHVLLLDGVPIAGLISGSFADLSSKKLYCLHMVFDDRYAALSPGVVTFLLAMRYACEGRYSACQLLSGFGYFKSRWLAEGTPTRSAQIYRIGSPLDCKRKIGDATRWILNRSPEARGDEIRDGYEKQDELNETIDHTQAERQRFDLIVEEARQGECEILRGDALAAVMPFRVDSSPSTKPVTRAQSGFRIPASTSEATPIPIAARSAAAS